MFIRTCDKQDTWCSKHCLLGLGGGGGGGGEFGSESDSFFLHEQAGLGSLFSALKLYNTEFHSLGLHFTRCLCILHSSCLSPGVCAYLSSLFIPAVSLTRSQAVALFIPAVSLPRFQAVAKSESSCYRHSL